MAGASRPRNGEAASSPLVSEAQITIHSPYRRGLRDRRRLAYSPSAKPLLPFHKPHRASSLKPYCVIIPLILSHKSLDPVSKIPAYCVKNPPPPTLFNGSADPLQCALTFAAGKATFTTAFCSLRERFLRIAAASTTDMVTVVPLTKNPLIRDH